MKMEKKPKTQEPALVKALMHDKLSLEELVSRFKLPKEMLTSVMFDLTEKGYDIRTEKVGKASYFHIKMPNDQENYVIISPRDKRSKELKWLAISDTHIGCRQFDESGFRKVLEQGVREGYKHAYFSGDLVDGIDVYKGQMNNLTAWRLEDQVAEAKRIFVDYPLDYYAISGNHDYSWVQKGAPNPVRLLDKEVPNFTFVGDTVGDILLEGMLMRLVHGAGGTAYAKSYAAQKYLRSLFGSGKTMIDIDNKEYPLQILQIGHYHTNLHFDEFGVKVIHPGAFQKPNDFTIRRGLEGPRGCYFITALVQDGKLKEFLPRWVSGDK